MAYNTRSKTKSDLNNVPAAESVKQAPRSSKKKESSTRSAPGSARTTPSTPSSASQMSDEILIAVMGCSGVGKSTFINLVSNSSVRTSDGLDSCTETIELSEPFTLDGHRIRLIDTPGFDDSSKSDVDILEVIATFLSTQYGQGRRLTGVIYMHRITDPRIGGVARRNLTMFQKLCGEQFFPNVVLVTTRWSEVEPQLARVREEELTGKDIFFKPVIDGGAKYCRHSRGIDSANDIIRCFLGLQPRTLLIQEEMFSESRGVSETSAGKELLQDISEQIQKQDKEMRHLQEEMQEALQEHDREKQQDIQEELSGQHQALKRLQAQVTKLSTIRFMRGLVAQSSGPSTKSVSETPISLSLGSSTPVVSNQETPTASFAVEPNITESLRGGNVQTLSDKSTSCQDVASQKKGKGRSDGSQKLHLTIQSTHTETAKASTSASTKQLGRGTATSRRTANPLPPAGHPTATTMLSPALTRHQSAGPVPFPAILPEVKQARPRDNRRAATIDVVTRPRSPTTPILSTPTFSSAYGGVSPPMTAFLSGHGPILPSSAKSDLVHSDFRNRANRVMSPMVAPPGIDTRIPALLPHNPPPTPSTPVVSRSMTVASDGRHERLHMQDDSTMSDRERIRALERLLENKSSEIESLKKQLGEAEGQVSRGKGTAEQAPTPLRPTGREIVQDDSADGTQETIVSVGVAYGQDGVKVEFPLRNLHHDTQLSIDVSSSYPHARY